MRAGANTRRPVEEGELASFALTYTIQSWMERVMRRMHPKVHLRQRRRESVQRDRVQVGEYASGQRKAKKKIVRPQRQRERERAREREVAKRSQHSVR